jgi:hypothetical protein
MICREDFRVTYKEEHPKNKSVAAVSCDLMLFHNLFDVFLFFWP